MKGAQPLKAGPCGLERHVVRNEAHDIARIPNRRDEIFRERDGQLGHLPGPIRGGLPTAPGRKKDYPLPLRSCANRFNSFLRAASAFRFFLTLGFS